MVYMTAGLISSSISCNFQQYLAHFYAKIFYAYIPLLFIINIIITATVPIASHTAY